VGQIPDTKGIRVTAIAWGLELRELILEKLTCLVPIAVCIVDNE